MSHRRYALSLAVALPVAACSGPPPAATDANQTGSVGGPVTEAASNQTLPAGAADNAGATDDIRDADYLGRWTGVEGMYLQVDQGDAPGRFRLELQYDLDHKQTVDAKLDGSALVFRRNGEREALRPTDGVATGLKYLADKKDCLTVGAGEGYCRD